jgi:tricarballylate dehydrogenase
MGVSVSGRASGAGGERRVDVLVVGTGIAGLSAAIAAAEAGRSVLVVDAADEQHAGGNSQFSVGVARFAFEGPDDLATLLGPGLPTEQPAALPYPADTFLADLRRVTRGQGDPFLHALVARNSRDLVRWLGDHGVRWTLTPFRFGRDPERPDGPPALPPGAPLIGAGGGRAIVGSMLASARSLGVRFRFGAPVRSLSLGSPPGVELDPDGTRVAAGALVLAAGAFDASSAARARFLGEGWDLVRCRGSRFNTGRVLEAALEAGAAPAGHWNGVHAVASAPGGPPHGDHEVGDVHGRYAYPYGISVNLRGERFFDEGADEKNFTYATVGRYIHAQPEGVAYQLFDDRATKLLEPRYSTSAPAVADSIDELAGKLPFASDRLTETVRTFNDACSADCGFDPFALDGLAAKPPGQPPKSNWAVPLSSPPFRAYPVVPAITFAFAGLAVDARARVLTSGGDPLDNVYACGDIVGGIAFHNLPAGTGMIAAGVLGRLAGDEAAEASGRRLK